MIIKQNSKLIAQGAVIVAVAEPDQWTISVTVAGPAAEGSSPQIFELLFSHADWDRLQQRDAADRIVTVLTSLADPAFVAYSVDPRGAAGLKVWIQRKLGDPLYQSVARNDYIMHARRWGFDALQFEQLPGLFTEASGRFAGEQACRAHRTRLEGK